MTKKRRLDISYKFGYLGPLNAYRHYPILWFAHGTNGFTFCILGLTITAKLW